MKTRAFLSAILTFFTIIAIISLCLLEVVVIKHRNKSIAYTKQDSLYWAENFRKWNESPDSNDFSEDNYMRLSSAGWIQGGHIPNDNLTLKNR